MIIGSIKENLASEKRVSITPESAKNIINLGLKVIIEKNYAEHLGLKDDEYKKNGQPDKQAELLSSFQRICQLVDPTVSITSEDEMKSKLEELVAAAYDQSCGEITTQHLLGRTLERYHYYHTAGEGFLLSQIREHKQLVKADPSLQTIVLKEGQFMRQDTAVYDDLKCQLLHDEIIGLDKNDDKTGKHYNRSQEMMNKSEATAFFNSVDLSSHLLQYYQEHGLDSMPAVYHKHLDQWPDRNLSDDSSYVMKLGQEKSLKKYLYNNPLNYQAVMKLMSDISQSKQAALDEGDTLSGHVIRIDDQIGQKQSQDGQAMDATDDMDLSALLLEYKGDLLVEKLSNLTENYLAEKTIDEQIYDLYTTKIYTGVKPDSFDCLNRELKHLSPISRCNLLILKRLCEIPVNTSDLFTQLKDILPNLDAVHDFTSNVVYCLSSSSSEPHPGIDEMIHALQMCCIESRVTILRDHKKIATRLVRFHRPHSVLSDYESNYKLSQLKSLIIEFDPHSDQSKEKITDMKNIIIELSKERDKLRLNKLYKVFINNFSPLIERMFGKKTIDDYIEKRNRRDILRDQIAAYSHVVDEIRPEDSIDDDLTLGE